MNTFEVKKWKCFFVWRPAGYTMFGIMEGENYIVLFRYKKKVKASPKIAVMPVRERFLYARQSP